jgi:hypothetical protein
MDRVIEKFDAITLGRRWDRDRLGRPCLQPQLPLSCFQRAGEDARDPKAARLDCSLAPWTTDAAPQ